MSSEFLPPLSSSPFHSSPLPFSSPLLYFLFFFPQMLTILGLGENTDFRSFLRSFTSCFVCLLSSFVCFIENCLFSFFFFNSLFSLVGARQTQWKHCMPVGLSPLGPCWCMCRIPVLVAEDQFSFKTSFILVSFSLDANVLQSHRRRREGV